MPRFFVAPEDIHGDSFLLRGTEAHHALSVLRLDVGDELDCFDGKDLAFHGRIVSRHGDEFLEGIILSHMTSTRVEGGQITLCQGLLKGPKWDWFLEKACEIGVHRVIPLLTERTIVKSGERDAQKLERWQKIILAASKQSGRNALMQIDAPITFFQALDEIPTSVSAYLPWEKEDDIRMRGIRGNSVWLFVGPEGGWDPKEVAFAKRRGVQTVRLGPTLLRSETAGVVAATLAMREFDIY